MKAVNSEEAVARDPWHKWVRGALPRALVVQDIDGYALPVSDPVTDAPLLLIEHKRSHIAVDHWLPYPADRRNYAAMLEVARRCEIPLLVVYQRTADVITNATPLRVIRLVEARPEYVWKTNRIMPAGEFARGISALCGKPRQESAA